MQEEAIRQQEMRRVHERLNKIAATKQLHAVIQEENRDKLLHVQFQEFIRERSARIGQDLDEKEGRHEIEPDESTEDFVSREPLSNEAEIDRILLIKSSGILHSGPQLWRSILGLSGKGGRWSVEEIKKAARSAKTTLVLATHPDKQNSNSPSTAGRAAEALTIVLEAYEKLSAM